MSEKRHISESHTLQNTFFTFFIKILVDLNLIMGAPEKDRSPADRSPSTPLARNTFIEHSFRFSDKDMYEKEKEEKEKRKF